MLSDIDMFSAIADKYGDSINTTKEAEGFFQDFMKQTEGWVIVDFLDQDNDDHIEGIAFNHEHGLLTLYTQLPEHDPLIAEMRRMVFPCDTYSILVRFKNIRFVRIKDNKCLAIVINGYTMPEKMIKQYAESIQPDNLNIDAKYSFFTTNLLREKDKKIECIRAITTPITSFWILSKDVDLHSTDSEYLLYQYNVDNLSQNLDKWWNKLSLSLEGLTDTEEIDGLIGMYGNKIRCIAEALFKLITCFYSKTYPFKEFDTEYSDKMLGKLIGPLKQHIYNSESDTIRLNKIVRIANEFSHDTGFPFDLSKLKDLYSQIKYYIADFNKKIELQDNKPQFQFPDKPSPKAFIVEKLKTWTFLNQINDIADTSESKCCFRITINSPFAHHSLFDEADNYLCKDGKVRELKRNDLSDALTLHNRDAVISLCKAIESFVITECESNGFDSSGYVLNQSIQLEKIGIPTHLFTLDEIKDLMRAADDSVNNKLVIDEDGFPHLIQDINIGYTYPVSQETWYADNSYVGVESLLTDAENAYHLCLKLWLAYLLTGTPKYGDFYVPVDEEELIGKIKAETNS